MSYVVTAMRHLISGGPMGAVWQSVAVLSVFTVAAGILTTLTTRRQRVWTLPRREAVAEVLAATVRMIRGRVVSGTGALA